MVRETEKPRRRLVINLLAVLLFAAVAMLLMPSLTRGRNTTVQPSAAGFEIIRDVVYAEVDDQRLALDILDPRPDSAVSRPVAVFIHGGAWRGGDKRGGAIYLRQLVEAGYLCFSINYRLSDVAHYPAQIHDCKAAIRWIRFHCADYGGDPGRIAVLGTSAGGHLAALLGMSNGDPALEGTVGCYLDTSSAVQVVADWFGPSDMVVLGQTDLGEWHRGILEDLFGGPLEDYRDNLKEASPALHVDPGDVPVLVIHGTADETVSVEQSRHFHEVLRDSGVPVEYIEVVGGGHGKFRGCDPDQWELIQLMIGFFDKHLENTPVPAQT